MVAVNILMPFLLTLYVYQLLPTEIEKENQILLIVLGNLNVVEIKSSLKIRSRVDPENV